MLCLRRSRDRSPFDEKKCHTTPPQQSVEQPGAQAARGDGVRIDADEPSRDAQEVRPKGKKTRRIKTWR